MWLSKSLKFFEPQLPYLLNENNSRIVGRIKWESTPKKHCRLGTSLVVQWLKICLPVQGMQVWFLVGELRSQMHGSTKPLCHNHRACKPQLRPNAAIQIFKKRNSRLKNFTCLSLFMRHDSDFWFCHQWVVLFSLGKSPNIFRPLFLHLQH